MLGAVLLSNLISQRFSLISTPLIQIALGIIIALLPIFDFSLTLDPGLFLVLFIAPLLFEDAKKADKPTLWALKRPILLLALGLVFATCLAVGGFVHVFIPAIPLAAAFALAAALAPTDAVAVISLEQSTTIKPQKRALLQGEALFNDASSIVCFQFALAALAVGPLASHAGLEGVEWGFDILFTFLLVFIGGMLVGLVLMILRYFLVRLLRRAGIENITFHVLFELVTPFLVFLVAEALHVSGIIAVVVAGIAYSFAPRRQTPHSARHNIVSGSVWSVASFTLNGLVFLILGTQLPNVIDQVWLHSNADHSLLLIAIVLILLAIMLIRFVWVLVMNRKELLALERGDLLPTAQADKHVDDSAELAGLSRKEQREVRQKNRKEKKQQQRGLVKTERRTPGYFKAHARNALVLTLTGVKGAISLALLLTIPLMLPNGEGFPERSLLLFLASGVIILSLLLANFLVPLVSPKIAKPLASEDELKAILGIFQQVIHDLTSRMASDDKAAAEEVIRHYRDRIVTLSRSSQIIDPVEERLRRQIIEWQRDFTLHLVDEGRVSAAIGSAYVYQLSRMLARIEHRGETRWLISNVFEQVVHRIRARRRYRKEKAPETADEGKLGRRQSMHVIRELQRENYRHVLEELNTLKDDPEISKAIVLSFIIDYKQRLLRMDTVDHRRLPSNQHQGLEFQNKVLELETRALQYEREAIEKALSEGLISHETARKLRDNAAMMELDIEEQLE